MGIGGWEDASDGDRARSRGWDEKSLEDSQLFLWIRKRGAVRQLVSNILRTIKPSGLYGSYTLTRVELNKRKRHRA